MERHSRQQSNDQRVVIDGAQLSDPATVTVQDGLGALVVVENGTVWLTQEGDTRDIIVAAGERFRLDRNGRALIEALPNAVVTLTTGKDQSVPEVTISGSYTMASSLVRSQAPTARAERLRIAPVSSNSTDSHWPAIPPCSRSRVRSVSGFQ